jgi:IS66 C-terminal element
MRPVALSRKNSLFAGSDEGGENWACLASLIETCKLNGVNPQVYFTELLTRLVNGRPQEQIDELMPWLWVPQQPPTATLTRRDIRRVTEHRLPLDHGVISMDLLLMVVAGTRIFSWSRLGGSSSAGLASWRFFRMAATEL